VPTMLLSHDVVDVEGESGELLREEAVRAAIARAISDDASAASTKLPVS
jgi:hypothetical protein